MMNSSSPLGLRVLRRDLAPDRTEVMSRITPLASGATMVRALEHDEFPTDQVALDLSWRERARRVLRQPRDWPLRVLAVAVAGASVALPVVLPIALLVVAGVLWYRLSTRAALYQLYVVETRRLTAEVRAWAGQLALMTAMLLAALAWTSAVLETADKFRYPVVALSTAVVAVFMLLAMVRDWWCLPAAMSGLAAIGLVGTAGLSWLAKPLAWPVDPWEQGLVVIPRTAVVLLLLVVMASRHPLPRTLGQLLPIRLLELLAAAALVGLVLRPTPLLERLEGEVWLQWLLLLGAAATWSVVLIANGYPLLARDARQLVDQWQDRSSRRPMPLTLAMVVALTPALVTVGVTGSALWWMIAGLSTIAAVCKRCNRHADGEYTRYLALRGRTSGPSSTEALV